MPAMVAGGERHNHDTLLARRPSPVGGQFESVLAILPIHRSDPGNDPPSIERPSAAIKPGWLHGPAHGAMIGRFFLRETAHDQGQVLVRNGRVRGRG